MNLLNLLKIPNRKNKKSRQLHDELLKYKILQQVDVAQHHKNIISPIKSNSLKIAFVIPGLGAYSGGHTSILRLGTYLAEFGHNVYYVTFDNSSKQTMIKNAKLNLPYFKGEILDKSGLEDYYDVGIATLWLSAYYILNSKNFNYKAYFIQDFEPAFYPEGDLYWLAANTYNFNFHMISLGEWNKHRIKQLYPCANIDVIQFPFEINQYSITRRTIKIEETVKLVVYVKLDPKRAPVLLMQCIDLLYNELSKKGITLDISFFGMDNNIQPPIGKNLGKLNHKQLTELYKTSHLGVIASLTNISLVPYEMISCGLPIIEFEDGSAPHFFAEDSMIFSKIFPRDFVQKVLYYIENQDKLNALVQNAQRTISTKTWETSSRQFESIIQTGIFEGTKILRK